MKKVFINNLIAFTVIGANSASIAQVKGDSKAEVIDFDKRLKDLNIVLAKPSAPFASYVKTVRVGNAVIPAGHRQVLISRMVLGLPEDLVTI